MDTFPPIAPQDAAPHLRHPSSLEDIIDFSTKQPPLEPADRIIARAKFYRIVKHFQKIAFSRRTDYNRAALVYYTYEYSPSNVSKDMFLRAFFACSALSMDNRHDVDLENAQAEADIRSHVFGFADHLMNHFFIPSIY